jgi:predicted TIM-barrel fold metal-dependent hydrolase
MIVDFRFTPPTPEGLNRYARPAAHMKGYADAYGERVFGGKGLETMPADALVRWLDEQGVDRVLLKCADTETTLGAKYPMEKLHDYVRPHADRLLATAGVDPHKGVRAVRELEEAVRSYGFRAVNLSPFELRLHANDRKFYPIYTKCVELDIPVLLHTSFNLTRDISLDYGRPIHLDDVARDFPELKIVAVHGGWPWVLEMVALCWKYPNVYIEISGTMPKYIMTPNSGWDPLLVYGNGLIQDRVLWGSNWPMIRPGESLEWMRKFPLKEEVRRKWLGENAARLLKL